jgi:hypothetical protein
MGEVSTQTNEAADRIAQFRSKPPSLVIGAFNDVGRLELFKGVIPKQALEAFGRIS